MANKNISKRGLDTQIKTFVGDLFEFPGAQKYDLIIANPPYVDAESMARLPPEYRHEPADALDGGAEGLDILKRIIKNAASHLNERGILLCEVGTRRADIEKAFPKLQRKLYWLHTELSTDEVFIAKKADLAAIA